MPRKAEIDRARSRRWMQIYNILLLRHEVEEALNCLRQQFGIDLEKLKIAGEQLQGDFLLWLSKDESNIDENVINAAYGFSRVIAVMNHLVKNEKVDREFVLNAGLRGHFEGENEFHDELIKTRQKFHYEGIEIPLHYIMLGLCFDINKINLFMTELGQMGRPKRVFGKNHAIRLDRIRKLAEEHKIYQELIGLTDVIEYIDATCKLIYYDKGIHGTIKRWKQKTARNLKQDHIYLDITGLNIDDIQNVWGAVEFGRNIVGDITTIKRGRRKGELTINPPEIVHGMNWREVREYVRNDLKARSKLFRLENDYIQQEIERRKLKNPNPSNKLISEWRGHAIQNFYKNVIVHPEMKDLNLQIRKRGRPRKLL